MDKPAESAKPRSIGASLFGVEDDQVIAARAAVIEPDMESSSTEEEEEKKVEMPQMSTGEAIFADLPSVPNIGSTGATLFGMSDESAKVPKGFRLDLDKCSKIIVFDNF